MMWLFHDLVAFQREIYLTFAERIKIFAATGEWSLLLAYVPMGVLFGMAHALTPGHSKAVLATYLSGTTSSISRGVAVALVLSTVHVGISVIIALLSLSLVSVALGSVGRAPALEAWSRGLLGLIGLWMVWQAVREGSRHRGHGAVAGLIAGLIPCPLTLFVMTFAIARGVPSAGVVFASVMMVGVALVLSAVALAAVLFRKQLLRLLAARPRLMDSVSRTIQITAGLVLVVVALSTILS